MAKIRENMLKRKHAAQLKAAAAAQVAAERTTVAMMHAHERHKQAMHAMQTNTTPLQQ